MSLVSQFGFDAHNGVGRLACLGLFESGQREEPVQISFVGFADRLVLGVEVVVAVAHADARLSDVEGIDFAVLQIGLGTEAEQGRARSHLHHGQDRSELFLVVQRQDRFQFGPDGSGALLVQAYRVEAQLVEVGDLLIDRALRRVLLGHLGEELVDADFIVIVQHVEHVVARVFGFERIFSLPAARGVLVETLVGGDRGVHVGRIERRRRVGRFVLAAHHTKNGCSEKNFFHWLFTLKYFKVSVCFRFSTKNGSTGPRSVRARLICGWPPLPAAPCLRCIRAVHRRPSRRSSPCRPGRTC